MLDVLTAIVLAAAAVQTTMVQPEPDRLAAEAARAPLVSAPAGFRTGFAATPAGAGPGIDGTAGKKGP